MILMKGLTTLAQTPKTDLPRAGVAQLARASRCHREGRGFESRFPLHSTHTSTREVILGYFCIYS